MDNCNVVYNYTLSSYNMQQKGRNHTFNSYRNELYDILLGQDIEFFSNIVYKLNIISGGGFK